MKSISICAIILFAIIITGYNAFSQENEVYNLSDDLSVEKLADGIWLYTAYYDLAGLKHFPANGLIVIDGTHSIMIDLPWTDEQTGILFDWVKKEYNISVEKVVPTHFHIDCAGGLGEAHKRKAESFSLDKTAEILERTGKPIPENWFSDTLSLSCGSIRVELAYCGAGHTVDNIIAWLPRKKILFGGCLVKCLAAQTPGNLEDADLKEWPKTLMKVKEKYPSAEIIVPGHGDPGGLELIEHTMDLLEDVK